MALRPDRIVTEEYIDSFMDVSADTNPGGVVSYVTGASGVAMDQAENKVSYVANPSGVMPRGILMTKVTTKDLTQTQLNYYGTEVADGGKVNVLGKGEVTTDYILTGHTPTRGQRAYVAHSGYIANSDVATDDTDLTGATRIIGRFVTAKDEDGFARVAVNLP